jgi:hypothetical protein
MAGGEIGGAGERNEGRERDPRREANALTRRAA